LRTDAGTSRYPPSTRFKFFRFRAPSCGDDGVDGSSLRCLNAELACMVDVIICTAVPKKRCYHFHCSCCVLVCCCILAFLRFFRSCVLEIQASRLLVVAVAVVVVFLCIFASLYPCIPTRFVSHKHQLPVCTSGTRRNWLLSKGRVQSCVLLKYHSNKPTFVGHYWHHIGAASCTLKRPAGLQDAASNAAARNTRHSCTKHK
jgi:hypothetical protein